MTDPFQPLEDFKTPETYIDKVYPQSRYATDDIFQGKSIYKPSWRMMFKLMVACIGVTKGEELWFNQKADNLE